MEIPRMPAAAPGSGTDGPDPVGLLAAWWRAVGAPVARLASPRGILRRRLIVAVPDARWKRELGDHLEEILSRLRGAEGLPEILEIQIRVEPASDPSAPAPGHGRGKLLQGQESSARPPESERSLPSEIRLAAGSIPDSDQSRRWQEAVARILARREEIHDP